jgi:polar amino acid transport system permease protein
MPRHRGGIEKAGTPFSWILSVDEFVTQLWLSKGQLLQGLIATLTVSSVAIVIGSAAGLLVGIGLSFGWRPIRWLLRGYVDFVRGTPVLVLILASFYILAIIGVQFSAMGAGMFALALFCGAHLGEIVRGGLQAIPSTQIDAGRSVGLGMTQILVLILLPQALRQVLPVWVNTAVEIVKASTLLSVIGVGELLLKTQEIVGRTFLTLEFYVFAGAVFFLINFAIERLGKAVERRFALR